MGIAVYYDEKLEGVGMEFLEKGEVRKAFTGTRLDYSTVGQWLSEHGKGDVIVFLQDVLPYTAFNSPYSDLFSLDNNLGKFVSRGGTVVWLGDVPFFYRVRCDKGVDKQKVEQKFKEGLKFVLKGEFFLNKFHATEVDGYGVCFRDIISNWHFDEYYSLRFISLSTRYLRFFDISKVCYLEKKVEVRGTLLSLLLGYKSNVSLRPVKLDSEYMPLNVTKLLTPSCSGRYAGSWVRQIGEGYFVRLYDYTPTAGEVTDAIRIGEEVARVVSKPAGEVLG
ncbi:hypothetical protein [Stygiolobus caldivivus]|uniref:Uncharacterized protein n=1 Tax=Stygiolobus caldivivus TaxID=2824673 RepID=A0A8D5U5C1_9CREN|nr:hypothetical protein [Stygiolobus caldivivus]BCU69761.1 hypothetical protein KN1_10580 [Stygiolobus caldivivus]